MVRVRFDEVIDRHAAALAEIEIIFRHLLPTLRLFGAAGDNQRAFDSRWMQQRIILSSNLGGHSHLFLYADLHDYFEIVHS